MANHAYASVWTRNFSAESMLGRFEALLDTVPFSAAKPGFTQLLIGAVGPDEMPLVERDLRAHPLTAAELVEMAREHVNPDCCYEATTHWDLWVYDLDAASWQQQPQRLEIACFGEEHDGGIFHEAGHFQADLGFEHLFTGHAGLLGFQGRRAAPPQHPAEEDFLNRMSKAENRQEYQEKTRENIRLLLDWTWKITAAIPLERYRLWSEGEENFEARLDEIVAAR